MKVQLIVSHQEASADALERSLGRIFGQPEVRESILESPVLRQQEAFWAKNVFYATNGPRFRVFCTQNSNAELQVLVEPKEDEDSRIAAQSIWEGLERALRGLRPKLVSAEITIGGRPIFSASTGLWANLGPPEIRLALAVGLVNVLWIAIAGSSFAEDKLIDLFTGAAPALVTAVVFGSVALQGTRTRRLQWQS